LKILKYVSRKLESYFEKFNKCKDILEAHINYFLVLFWSFTYMFIFAVRIISGFILERVEKDDNTKDRRFV